MAEEPALPIATILKEVLETLNRVNRLDAARLLEQILASPAVFVAGAGRSGLLLRCFAMRLAHLGMTAHVVGETTTPPIKPGQLLLIGSGSGETPGMCALAKRAGEMDAAIAVITTNPASTLVGLADVTVLLDAPTPKASVKGAAASAQPMGSLFEQSMFLFLEAVIMELMRRTDIRTKEMFKNHANLE